MERRVVVRGRLQGRHIDLEESVDQLEGEVEVVVRSVEPARMKPVESIFEFIRKLPPGTRTKEDIDRQIAEERDSWGRQVIAPYLDASAIIYLVEGAAVAQVLVAQHIA